MYFKGRVVHKSAATPETVYVLKKEIEKWYLKDTIHCKWYSIGKHLQNPEIREAMSEQIQTQTL